MLSAIQSSMLGFFVCSITTIYALNTTLESMPSKLSTSAPAEDELAVDRTEMQKNVRAASLSQEELAQVDQCLKQSASALERCRDAASRKNSNCPLKILHKIWSFLVGGDDGPQDGFKSHMDSQPMLRSWEDLEKYMKLFSQYCTCIQDYALCCTDSICVDCEHSVAANLPAYMNEKYWAIYKASEVCGGILAGLPCHDGPEPSKHDSALGIILLILFGLIVAGLVIAFVVKKGAQANQYQQPKTPGQMPPKVWMPTGAVASNWSSGATSSRTSSMFSGNSAASSSKTMISPATFMATSSRSRTPGKSLVRPKSAHRKRSPYSDDKRRKSPRKQNSTSLATFQSSIRAGSNSVATSAFNNNMRGH